jgi:tight adherence protein B
MEGGIDSMTAILILACAGFITGAFVLLGIKPLDFTDGVFQMLTNKPKSLKAELKETVGRKKPNILKREMMEAQTVLEMTGRSRMFPVVCASSLFCFIGGAAFAMMLNNIFLVPVMAIGMMFVPFWYVKLIANNYKKEINAELETALSIITTAYLRCEDIITAVDENIEYLNPPAKSVFADFLAQVRLINPDIDAALRVMRTRIDNDVFREWVDAIAACQHDRSLKTTLTPVVAKLSDIRVVNAELDFLIFEPRKEFITMAILVIANIPLMYFLNKDWYDILMHTVLGHIILAVTAAVIFISTAFVLKLTKPIEYKR